MAPPEAPKPGEQTPDTPPPAEQQPQGQQLTPEQTKNLAVQQARQALDNLRATIVRHEKDKDQNPEELQDAITNLAKAFENLGLSKQFNDQMKIFSEKLNNNLALAKALSAVAKELLPNSPQVSLEVHVVRKFNDFTYDLVKTPGKTGEDPPFKKLAEKLGGKEGIDAGLAIIQRVLDRFLAHVLEGKGPNSFAEQIRWQQALRAAKVSNKGNLGSAEIKQVDICLEYYESSKNDKNLTEEQLQEKSKTFEAARKALEPRFVKWKENYDTWREIKQAKPTGLVSSLLNDPPHIGADPIKKEQADKKAEVQAQQDNLFGIEKFNRDPRTNIARLDVKKKTPAKLANGDTISLNTDSISIPPYTFKLSLDSKPVTRMELVADKTIGTMNDVSIELHEGDKSEKTTLAEILKVMNLDPSKKLISENQIIKIRDLELKNERKNP